QRLPVIGPPAARALRPGAGLRGRREVREVTGVVAERRQAPEEDGLRVAHRGPPCPGERETASGRDRDPFVRDRGEIVVGRPGRDARDLLDERRAADALCDELFARRAIRRWRQDAVEAARPILGRLRPPLPDRRRLRAPGVLILEDRRPPIPAVHLPEVDDARPRARRPRLLPRPDERARRTTRLALAGVALVRVGARPDDVDDLVEVELLVR